VTVEAVVFDVGNTLLSVAEDPHARALRGVTHLGRVSFEHYRRALTQAQREWAEAGGAPEIEDLPDTWIRHITRALELAQFPGDCRYAAQLMEDSFLVDGWEVFPEADGVLRTIQGRGIRMGVVSNWPASLELALEAAGIRKYFEVIVASGVVGYAKPRPEIYRLALERFGIAPHRALFVGDSIALDVKGPASVGMPSVLLDRQRCFGDHPHVRVDSLQQLLDHLP
jgi:HAD superfamily hydrolase (TIGR01509 family)